MKRKKTLSPEQQAKRDNRRAKFAALVKQIGDMTDDDRAALAAKMMVTNCDGHTLSVRNQLLVAMQLGTAATIVGGFRQWIKQGRCVRKGQHGASILFPRTFGEKQPNECAEPEARDNGKPGGVRFLSGTVFDISQTDIVTEQDKPTTAAELFVPPAPNEQDDEQDDSTPEPLTIWNSDGVDAPALICAPPPLAKNPILMNRPPPGGWTEADKVPRKTPTPQVPAMAGMSALGLWPAANEPEPEPIEVEAVVTPAPTAAQSQSEFSLI